MMFFLTEEKEHKNKNKLYCLAESAVWQTTKATKHPFNNIACSYNCICRHIDFKKKKKIFFLGDSAVPSHNNHKLSLSQVVKK